MSNFSYADWGLNRGMPLIKSIKDREELVETKSYLDQIVSTVRNAFGSFMTEEDVINHVLEPNHLFLYLNGDYNIKGLFAYSDMDINGENVLFVDGVALDPSIQSKGLFRAITENNFSDRKYIGLKTQNPFMYRALEKMCSSITPSLECYSDDFTEGIAERLNKIIDQRSVIRGEYGSTLYGEIPLHKDVSTFFEDELFLDYKKGDSVVCCGKR